MGGWTGTIERVQRNRIDQRRRCWVHFIDSTISRLHSVYLDREERDNDLGYEPWDNWLGEELLAPGEVPPGAIEHPHLPAWAEQAGDPQVRLIFGLEPEDDYPSCSADTARVWRNFLTEHIPLPRRLRAAASHDSGSRELLLRRILEPDEVASEVDDKPHGLYAEVSVDNEIEVTRLDDVMLFDDDPYETLLCDYAHWYDEIHGDDEGMSFAEFKGIVRSAFSAWEGNLNQLPDEFGRDLAKPLADQIKNPQAGRFLDRREQPVVEEPEDSAVPAPIRAAPRVGRNDPCPCGSGKKFKKCCLRER
jgi:hypothetical protein